MTKEEIAHRDGRIDLMRHGSGWKAFAYRTGSGLAESIVPHGGDRESVIAEAKRLLES